MGPRPTVPAPDELHRRGAQPRTAVAVLSAMALWSAAAGAQAPGDSGIRSLDGTCDRLVVGPDDYSSACQGTVLLMMVAPGRMMAIFTTEDGRAVVFSGNGRRAVLGPDWLVQPIDIVRTGYDTADLRSFDVSGRCAVSTPEPGPGRIECYAESGDAVFAAALTLDAPPPAATP
jgi:hypothetical protein